MKRTYALVIGTALVASLTTAFMSRLFTSDSRDPMPLSMFYSASSEYSVFRPGMPAVRFPFVVENEAKSLVAGDKRPGLSTHLMLGPRIQGSERVLQEIPGTGQRVFGFATAYGRACQIVIGIGAGCDGGPTAKQPVSWMASTVDRHGPLLIVGMVPDGVTRVDLIVDHKALPTKLANNSFYAEIRRNRVHHVTALRIAVSNGDVTTSDLPFARDLRRSITTH